MEKQIRVMIFHTLVAYHKCDSDRHAAWTITHYTVNADEQKSFFKLSREILGTDLVSHSCQAAKAGRTVERSSLGWKVKAS